MCSSGDDKKATTSAIHSARFDRAQLRDTKTKGDGVIWNFLQRYDESWIWRCTDHHAVTESSRNFAAREECVADAALHGYTAPATRAVRLKRGPDAERIRRRRKSEGGAHLP
jgi:hypothetical protein